MSKKEKTPFFTRILIFFREKYSKIKEKRIFHRLDERQRLLASYHGKESCEEAVISYRFAWIKIICSVLLVLTLLLTLIFGAGIISYENVYYMFKDIGHISSFSEGQSTLLSYSVPVENQFFASFKNGLAVAADSEIKFFTSTGRMTLSLGSDCVNPKICTSNNNALVYDQGRKHFSVYNSFVSLYSENLDYPISCADMADNGAFVVTTQSAKYASVLKIYDNSFKLRHEYNKNDRVLSVAMSDNGRYVAALSMSAEDGQSVVFVSLVDCKKNEANAIFEIKGSLPYYCKFLGDDRILLLCNDKMYVMDKKGKVQSEHAHPSSLTFSSVYDGNVALAYNNENAPGESKVAVFNSDGKLFFSANVTGNVKDVKLGKGCIYLLYQDKIERIDMSFGVRSVTELNGENAEILVLNDGEVLVCGRQFAQKVSFE